MIHAPLRTALSLDVKVKEGSLFGCQSTTDVLTIDALNSLRRLFFAKLFDPHVESTEELVCSRLFANP